MTDPGRRSSVGKPCSRCATGKLVVYDVEGARPGAYPGNYICDNDDCDAVTQVYAETNNGLAGRCQSCGGTNRHSDKCRLVKSEMLQTERDEARAIADGYWRREWVDARDAGWEWPEFLPWMDEVWQEENGIDQYSRPPPDEPIS